MPTMVLMLLSALPAFLWGWLLEAVASRSTRLQFHPASSSLKPSHRKLSSTLFPARETDATPAAFPLRDSRGSVAGISPLPAHGEEAVLISWESASLYQALPGTPSENGGFMVKAGSKVQGIGHTAPPGRRFYPLTVPLQDRQRFAGSSCICVHADRGQVHVCGTQRSS